MNPRKAYIVPSLAGLVILASLAANLPAGQDEAAAALAKQISAASRNQTGFCSVVGSADGALAVEMARGGKWLTHGLDRRADMVKAARQRAIEASLYGQVTFEKSSLEALPYADGMVNLLVLCEDANIAASAALLKEVARVLAPGACAVVLKAGSAGPPAKTVQDALAAAGLAATCVVAEASEKFLTITRKPSTTTDDWTHWGYGPGETFVSNDKDFRPPNSLRWLTGPCRAANVPLILSAGGRTFYVLPAGIAGKPTLGVSATLPRVASGLVLVARDASNGMPLWRRAYEGNPKTLVAVGDQLLTTAGGHLVALQAATGETAKDYGLMSDVGQILVSGDSLLVLCQPAGKPAEVIVMDLATAKQRWSFSREGVTKCLVGDGKVFLCSAKEIVALDLAAGGELWHTDPNGTVLCVKQGVVAVMAGKGADSTVHALSVKDGKKLWSHAVAPDKVPPQRRDVVIADGLVWVEHWLVKQTQSTRWFGLDAQTGQVKKTLDVQEYIPYACYPTIATEQYCVMNRPNDLMKWYDGSISEFRAARNGCGASGIIAGGLYTTVPNVCSCTPGTLRGFTAFGCEDVTLETKSPRLVAGDAKTPASAPASEPSPTDAPDWPSYRHDHRRSGSAAVEMPADVKVLWDRTIGSGTSPATMLGDEWRSNPLGCDKLTAPVVAGGRVFIGLPETHQVVAMNATDGKEIWRFTAEGRLDVPPTIYDGLCLFGTRSGYVYCLRADDGELVWRFRAAARERLVVTYGQLESRWPVIGGVLVCGDLAYVLSGRSTEIDGGLTIHALEPRTGKVVWSCTPTRNQDTGFMGIADLLVSDGRSVSIGGSNQAMFDLATGRHLPRGEFFALRAAFRTFEKDRWLIKFGPEGDQHGSLLGRDRMLGRFGGTQSFQGQTGRLIVFDASSQLVNYSVEVGGGKKPSGKLKLLGRESTERLGWAIDLADGRSVEAMAGATNTVVMAMRIEEPSAAARHELWGVSKESGQVVWKQPLKDGVLPDGLAIAGGKLYVSTAAGQVLCLGAP